MVQRIGVLDENKAERLGECNKNKTNEERLHVTQYDGVGGGVD